MTTTIILPGLDGTGDLLDAFVAATPEGSVSQLLRYPTDEKLGYDDLHAFVLEQIPNDGDVRLIGESFSGPLAVRLAEALGPRVQQLVLVATFVRSPAPRVAALVPWKQVFGLTAPRWALRRYLACPRDDKPLVARVRTAIGRVDADVMAHRMRSLIAVDARAALTASSCPVLYLQADQDRVVPSRCGDEIRACRPDVHVERMSGSHLILQQQPETAWEHIERFSKA